MTSLKNTFNHYGLIAIFLHWLIALLIFIMIGLGLYMVDLPIGLTKLKLFGWHKELGVLILGLAILRLLWRAVSIHPKLPANLPSWQIWAANFVHWAFYFFLFALPLSGWMLSSASSLPISFFGLFVLPDLISPNESLRLLLITTHQWLAYTLIGVICIHIAAALQHHFIQKDDILRRMLP